MRIERFVLLFGLGILSIGCSFHMPTIPVELPQEGPVVFGKVHVQLTGPTTRWYEPEVRFIEFMNRTSGHRYRIDPEAADSLFFLPLPVGEYELTRIQIREGGFRSMAQLSSIFPVWDQGVQYVGTWKIQVNPPQTNRLLILSFTSNLDEVAAEVMLKHPKFLGRGIITHLPSPTPVETRLYEITPYPLARWFNRHQSS